MKTLVRDTLLFQDVMGTSVYIAPSILLYLPKTSLKDDQTDSQKKLKLKKIQRGLNPLLNVPKMRRGLRTHHHPVALISKTTLVSFVNSRNRSHIYIGRRVMTS